MFEKVQRTTTGDSPLQGRSKTMQGFTFDGVFELDKYVRS